MPWHMEASSNLTMVRTRTHKLVRTHGLDGGELYDLVADPAETTNLWHDPASADIRAELALLLADRMAETVDPLPPRVANW